VTGGVEMRGFANVLATSLHLRSHDLQCDEGASAPLVAGSSKLTTTGFSQTGKTPMAGFCTPTIENYRCTQTIHTYGRLDPEHTFNNHNRL
jgi:hypothetical protein